MSNYKECSRKCNRTEIDLGEIIFMEDSKCKVNQTEMSNIGLTTACLPNKYLFVNAIFLKHIPVRIKVFIFCNFAHALI